MDQTFDELEILGGSTKSGGAMQFKYKTEQAILDNIGVSSSSHDPDSTSQLSKIS